MHGNHEEEPTELPTELDVLTRELRRLLGRRRRLPAWGGTVAEPPVTFAALLRKLRTEARLAQEELAVVHHDSL
jgi:hypothetical protein